MIRNITYKSYYLHVMQKKLLSHHQLKKLSDFAKLVGHDLKPWLIRERRRSAKIEDFETALATLHLQFNLPYPQSLDFEAHSTNINNNNNHSHLQNSSSDPPISQSNGTKNSVLQALFHEMQSSQCYEWSLLIATVLLNVNQIIQILKDNVNLLKPYQRLLAKQESNGYKKLLQIVDERF